MQQDRWNIRKATFFAVLAVSVMVSMIFWFIRSGATLDFGGSSIIVIQFVVIAFAIIVVFRRLKSAKQNLPAEMRCQKEYSAKVQLRPIMFPSTCGWLSCFLKIGSTLKGVP